MWPLRPARGTAIPAAVTGTAVLAALAVRAAQEGQVAKVTVGAVLTAVWVALLGTLAVAIAAATGAGTVGGMAVATGAALGVGLAVGLLAGAARVAGEARLTATLRGELAAVREQLRLEQAWGDRLLETVEHLEASLKGGA